MTAYFSDWTSLWYASEWLIRLLVIPLVLRIRQPAVATAWLLVMFFQPWVGLILYLLVGANRLPNRRIRLYRSALRDVGLEDRLAAQGQFTVSEVANPRISGVVRLAQELGQFPIVAGNAVEITTETDEFIDRLIDDIDRAESHVHVLVYIYADDETGNRVADALVRAAARGVRCRLLVDQVGSWRLIGQKLPGKLKQAGVEFHMALEANPLRRRLARMDLRNHRKIAVIDGRVAYTGSQNIVNANYGHKDLAWYDMMVRLTGPAVLQLQGVFLEDWYYETGDLPETPDILPPPETTGPIVAQTLPSGPSYPMENYQRMVVAMLYAAERQVTITTPYFVPDEATLQALQVAVMRGVKVELVMPEFTDQALALFAGRGYVRDVLEYGVDVYFYKPGLLHAKTISVDQSLALIGSANLDIRSFRLNFEINLLFYGDSVATLLRSRQQTYISQCWKPTLHQWTSRSRVRRFLENLARLVSPLL